MPSLRALLVRAFPRFLGSGNRSTGAKYFNSKQSHAGGNVSMVRATVNAKARENAGIRCERRYSVQVEEDETHLVELDVFKTQASPPGRNSDGYP